MKNTLYEIHLLFEGQYKKEYIRAKTTEELKEKLEQLKDKGEILSIEAHG